MDGHHEVTLLLDGSDHRTASLEELLRELIADAAASGNLWIRMTSARDVNASEFVRPDDGERN